MAILQRERRQSICSGRSPSKYSFIWEQTICNKVLRSSAI